MTLRRMGKTSHISELMGATLGSARIAKGIKKAQAILLWPSAVGHDIARMTRARSLQGSTLFVEVRDSATAHHLSMQRHHFLKALNALLPEAPVKEIRFGVGTIRPLVSGPPSSPLPLPDLMRAKQMVEGVKPDLYSVALKAAEAITRARKWREEQGWRPCPVCAEASKEHPCRACQLTLQDPNVRRAFKLLLRQPTHLADLSNTLGDSGAAAARYLALELLTDQIELLALECVCSEVGPEEIKGSYQVFLKQQADIYLSLALRKPPEQLGRKDRAYLPERTRNVLSSLN